MNKPNDDSVNIVQVFKKKLIEQIKQETEHEIQVRVKEFEDHLREMTSAKIVSFVDELKVLVKEDMCALQDPKIIIEVHL